MWYRNWTCDTYKRLRAQDVIILLASEWSHIQKGEEKLFFDEKELRECINQGKRHTLDELNLTSNIPISCNTIFGFPSLISTRVNIKIFIFCGANRGLHFLLNKKAQRKDGLQLAGYQTCRQAGPHIRRSIADEKVCVFDILVYELFKDFKNSFPTPDFKYFSLLRACRRVGKFSDQIKTKWR